MRKSSLSVLFGLLGFCVPLVAFSASSEGVPSYYSNNYGTQKSVSNAVYTNNNVHSPYVGQNDQKKVVGQRSYSYDVYSPTQPTVTGTMTPNGVAINPADEPNWVLSVDYARKYAKFGFQTGVNSRLEWNDMIFNEIGANARFNFDVRGVDMFAFGEYRYGSLGEHGLSMDYDLEPYDWKYPDYGLFTISMGDMSGKTNYMRFGLGARHIWDIVGWKLSPSFGYEVFNHDLEMTDHIYPNPGIYLPLMTQYGDYVYGDAQGGYHAVQPGTDVGDDLYQVCMSPEDIKVVYANADRSPGVTVDQNGNYVLITGDYQSIWGDLPWGVNAGECVIIGGDGPTIIKGTTHIYNTKWQGLFIGMEIEKQMTFSDKLRFYAQVGLPSYYAEGTWPNRTDWQQNPSFIDEGRDGSYSYQLEMEYTYTMSNRLQLSLKAETNFYRVGKAGGELYVASYTQWLVDENGQYVLDQNGYPILEVVEGHTEHISDSLKQAEWQSFGLHIGLKYAF